MVYRSISDRGKEEDADALATEARSGELAGFVQRTLDYWCLGNQALFCPRPMMDGWTRQNFFFRVFLSWASPKCPVRGYRVLTIQ